LFILATTDIHKVPATILSRCQRFDFRRVSVSAIAQRLLHIAEKEGYDLTPDAAEMIARLGDGSVRDSISLYDRCMPYNGTVDATRVTESLGMPDSDAIARMFDCITSRDGAGALEVFLKLYSDGKDIISVFDSLLSLVRDIYIVKLTNNAEYLSVNSIDRVKALADKTEMSSLEFYVNCISDLLQRLTRTAARRADGEVCLLKMTMGTASSPAPVVLTAPSAPVKSAAPTPKPEVQSTPKAAEPVSADVTPSITEPVKPQTPPPAPKPTSTAAATTASAPTRQENTASELKQKFVDIVNPKVSAGVRTFIGMSDIVAVDKRLRVEAPDVALRFITKPEYVEIFKQAATELGFSDVTVIKKEDAPPPLSPIDAILNKARNLGIPTEKR
jgi:DNA polymerase-3 subunit gamma/tau